jgi:membrane protein
MPSPRSRADRFLQEVRALSVRDLAVRLFEAFRENALLLHASSIAFRAAVAVIPLTLFALGLMGFLGLSEVWTADLAPRLYEVASPAAYILIDDTVEKVLTQGQLFWVTVGAVVTVWQVSGAVHAAMHALNAVYDTEEDRPFLEQLRVSILLGLASVAALLLAIAAAQGIPALIGGVIGFLVGWLLALVLLGLALGLLLRAGPDKSRPPGWVSFGTVLTVALWVLASVLFGLYLQHVASYDTIFGALATAFVALEYLYLSSIVFLAGVQTDAIVRDQIEKSG